MGGTTTGAWRSLDGSWSVQVLPGWIRDGRPGADFYQVKHHGKVVAEVDDFAALARFVPLQLLVDDDWGGGA